MKLVIQLDQKDRELLEEIDLTYADMFGNMQHNYEQYVFVRSAFLRSGLGKLFANLPVNLQSLVDVLVLKIDTDSVFPSFAIKQMFVIVEA